MLYYENGIFHKELYTAKVNFESQEQVLVNKDFQELNEEPVFEMVTKIHENISWIHDKEWFEEIQKRVFDKGPEEIIYEDIIFTEEQLARLEEINSYRSIEEYSIGMVFDYVLTGVMPTQLKPYLEN